MAETDVWVVTNLKSINQKVKVNVKVNRITSKSCGI